MVAEATVVFLRDAAMVCWCGFAYAARVAVAALREGSAGTGRVRRRPKVSVEPGQASRDKIRRSSGRSAWSRSHLAAAEQYAAPLGDKLAEGVDEFIVSTGWGSMCSPRMCSATAASGASYAVEPLGVRRQANASGGHIKPWKDSAPSERLDPGTDRPPAPVITSPSTPACSLSAQRCRSTCEPVLGPLMVRPAEIFNPVIIRPKISVCRLGGPL
jgi:hypothetical protein